MTLLFTMGQNPQTGELPVTFHLALLGQGLAKVHPFISGGHRNPFSLAGSKSGLEVPGKRRA